MPSMRLASFSTSSMDFTTLTPPALPRPPAWICAFTTHTGPPSSCAPLTASSMENAGTPRGTGTPNSRSTALAWYSWIFMKAAFVSRAQRSRRGTRRNRDRYRNSTPQIRRDLLAGLGKSLHRRGGFLKGVAFRATKIDLDDALDALGADHHRHADVQILDSVFAIEPGGARQHALLVAQIAFRHGNSRRRRGIEGRAGLQEIDDLRAAVRCTLNDLVDACLRGPAHLDEVRHRDAGDRRIARQRDHGVAVASEHESGDVFDRNVELVGEEIAEARRIEHAGHADHLLLRQAAIFLQRPHHGVERVGNADDESVGCVLLDAGADLLHHLEIDAEQIVTAHSRLARHAGGDDADVGAIDCFVAVGAGEMRIEFVDRRGLRDIQRLALRDTLHDVEHDDVAELLETDEVGERAADLASADQRNFVTRHDGKTLD